MKFHLFDNHAIISGINPEDIKAQLLKEGEVSDNFKRFAKNTPLGRVEAYLTWGETDVGIEVTKTPVFVSSNRVYMEIKGMVEKAAKKG